MGFSTLKLGLLAIGGYVVYRVIKRSSATVEDVVDRTQTAIDDANKAAEAALEGDIDTATDYLNAAASGVEGAADTVASKVTGEAQEIAKEAKEIAAGEKVPETYGTTHGGQTASGGKISSGTTATGTAKVPETTAEVIEKAKVISATAFTVQKVALESTFSPKSSFVKGLFGGQAKVGQGGQLRPGAKAEYQGLTRGEDLSALYTGSEYAGGGILGFRRDGCCNT